MDVRWLPVVIVIGMLYMDCVSVIAVVVVRCDFELRAYTVRREETQKMTRWNNKSGYFKVWFPVRLYKREDDATTTKTGFVVQFGVLRSQVALISDNLYIISIYIYIYKHTNLHVSCSLPLSPVIRRLVQYIWCIVLVVGQRCCNHYHHYDHPTTVVVSLSFHVVPWHSKKHLYVVVVAHICTPRKTIFIIIIMLHDELIVKFSRFLTHLVTFPYALSLWHSNINIYIYIYNTK